MAGGFNIAAAEKHWDITFKAIETVRNRSIAAHSEDLDKPMPADVGGFIRHFHDSCRTCHGAPGVSPAEFVDGLYPKPPTLHKTDTQKHWTDGEIVWIIANGIKMTAMPAFGPTHSVSEIHGLAGFVRKLPNMDEAAYRRLRPHPTAIPWKAATSSIVKVGTTARLPNFRPRRCPKGFWTNSRGTNRGRMRQAGMKGTAMTEMRRGIRTNFHAV